MAASPSPTGGPPLAGSPSFLIIGLGTRLRVDVERALSASGLSMRHLSALGHLRHEPGLSYSELGRRSHVTAQSMQATLRHLEERGAVERRTEAGRGRTAELHVTDLGVELLALGRRAYEAADRELLGDMDADQRAQLTALLRDVVVRGMAAGRE